jgi:hypothetical protein
MLRKGYEIKWIVESRSSFDQIKKVVTKEPVLISPNYSKYFMVLSFSSFDIVEVILLQKNEEGFE